MRSSKAVSGVLAVVSLLSFGCAEAADTVLVLAAASTIDALEAASTDFAQRFGVEVAMSFGPTSMAARQVVEGAPADLMLSASTDWADYVEVHAAVERRATVAGNRLVVVTHRQGQSPAGSAEAVLFDETTTRIAIADPESVPAGIYASQALRRLGLWERLAPKLVPTVDVRAALTLVVEREAEAGLVYASDAATAEGVRIAAEIDAELHAPIEYPLLLLAGSGPDAERFFDFLVSEQGRAHFLDRGFTAPGR
jgi:molybdate transport system substrate-binding protein